MDNQEYKEIMERLDFIEFRQDLIFSGSELDRSIYEYRLTKKQFTKIMDLMDEYRRKIVRRRAFPVARIALWRRAIYYENKSLY